MKPSLKTKTPPRAVAENIMADGKRIGIRFAWNPALCLRSVRAKTLAAKNSAIAAKKF